MNTSLTRISIVEPSKVWAINLLQEIKKTKDIQLVSISSNGEDALKKIPRTSPHIVLMAIELPQMNGIECMMRILQKEPQISFLMFTIHEECKYVFASLKGGTSGYILKQDGIEGAMNGIRELALGGSPMSHSVARRVLNSFRPNKRVIQKISSREREILHLLSKGLLYKEIAKELNPQINLGTVKQHVHHLYRKLGVNNRMEAVKQYLGYTC